jgi:hypothetical protein
LTPPDVKFQKLTQVFSTSRNIFPFISDLFPISPGSEAIHGQNYSGLQNIETAPLYQAKCSLCAPSVTGADPVPEIGVVSPEKP